MIDLRKESSTTSRQPHFFNLLWWSLNNLNFRFLYWLFQREEPFHFLLLLFHFHIHFFKFNPKTILFYLSFYCSLGLFVCFDFLPDRFIFFSPGEIFHDSYHGVNASGIGLFTSSKLGHDLSSDFKPG
jgi:hypothetical protein